MFKMDAIHIQNNSKMEADYMKVAIVGSRGLLVDDFDDLLPSGVTEIISGGARGIDRCAREYARRKGIPLREFLPDYARYGRGATHVRNREIVDAADCVVAVWDGQSRGTVSTMRYADRCGKAVFCWVVCPGVLAMVGDGLLQR